MSKLKMIVLGAAMFGALPPAIAGDTMIDARWQVSTTITSMGVTEMAHLGYMPATVPAWKSEVGRFAAVRPIAISSGSYDPADAGDVLLPRIADLQINANDGARWVSDAANQQACFGYCVNLDVSNDLTRKSAALRGIFTHPSIADPADAGKVLQVVSFATLGGESDPADAGDVLLSFDYDRSAREYSALYLPTIR